VKNWRTRVENTLLIVKVSISAREDGFAAVALTFCTRRDDGAGGILFEWLFDLGGWWGGGGGDCGEGLGGTIGFDTVCGGGGGRGDFGMFLRGACVGA